MTIPLKFSRLISNWLLIELIACAEPSETFVKRFDKSESDSSKNSTALSLSAALNIAFTIFGPSP